MAMTHDYLDQLDQNVGIAPANSQEEYQAAQTIADIMRRHGVEPSIEEFDAKAFGGVMDQILFAMLFVGMLLVGVGAVPLTVIGFVLVALPVAAFVARYLGNDFVEKLGPSARSQNVVAFHKGEGPLVQKGVRPIVIVAHYDTPHENSVYSTPLAPYLPMAWRFSKWCVLAVAVATLFRTGLPARGLPPHPVGAWSHRRSSAAAPCRDRHCGALHPQHRGCQRQQDWRGRHAGHPSERPPLRRAERLPRKRGPRRLGARRARL